MSVITSGVLFSHIQAVVPLYYKYGVSANSYFSSSYKLFDGLENTNYSIPSNNAAGFILGETISAKFYVYIHGYSGTITGTGQKFYIKQGSIVSDNFNIGGGDSLRGGTAEWAYSSPDDYFYLSVAPDSPEDIYFTCNGTSNTFTLVASGTTDNNIIGLYMGEDIKLPMYNQDYEVSITWESPGVKLDGKDGYYYLAKNRKWTKQIKFNWTELDDTSYDLFETFFAAFGNNLSQPFAFLIIHHDDIGGFTPILGVLDGNSISIENVGDGYTNVWNISFSMYILDEEMVSDVGPWY